MNGAKRYVNVSFARVAKKENPCKQIVQKHFFKASFARMAK
jgi:hypothetical protein